MIQVKPTDRSIHIDTPYQLNVGGTTVATGSIPQDIPIEVTAGTRVIIGSSTPPSGIDPAKIEANTLDMEKALSATLLGHRTYFLWGMTGMNSIDGMRRVIAADIKAGRSPYVSIKPPGGTWTGWKPIIDGTPDVLAAERAIAAALQQAATHDLVLLYSLHHEAENDRDLSGLTEAQKQAHRDQCYQAQVKHYDRLRQYGLPANVLLGPTWMNYTLTAEGTKKFGPISKWHQASGSFDFVGFDDYESTWDDNWKFAQGQVSRTGHPLPMALGEYGGKGSDQPSYLQDRLQWMYAHRGPGFIGAWWWNQVTLQAPALALLGQAIRAERG